MTADLYINTRYLDAYNAMNDGQRTKDENMEAFEMFPLGSIKTMSRSVLVVRAHCVESVVGSETGVCVR